MSIEILVRMLDRAHARRRQHPNAFARAYPRQA